MEGVTLVTALHALESEVPIQIPCRNHSLHSLSSVSIIDHVCMIIGSNNIVEVLYRDVESSSGGNAEQFEVAKSIPDNKMSFSTTLFVIYFLC